MIAGLLCFRAAKHRAVFETLAARSVIHVVNTARCRKQCKECSRCSEHSASSSAVFPVQVFTDCNQAVKQLVGGGADSNAAIIALFCNSHDGGTSPLAFADQDAITDRFNRLPPTHHAR